MDILIKNMEIPKRCKDCFALGISKCPSKNKVIEVNMTGQSRPYDCPLIALPPHGNLKDSQVILDLIYKHSAFPNVDVLWIEKLIKDAPTILEASK